MDSDEPLVVNRPRLVKDFIDLGVRRGGIIFLNASVVGVGWRDWAFG